MSIPFKIEKGVPIPSKQCSGGKLGEIGLALSKLKVGESIQIPLGPYARNGIYMFQKSRGWKLTLRTQDHLFPDTDVYAARVWRIK